MTSIMTVMLPIAIVLIIVGIVFFISKVGKDFISIKITHWLLIIYVSVLVLSTALIPFVTVDRKERETTKQEEMDQARNELFTKLNQGKRDQINDRNLLQSNRFTDYQNQTLRIVSRSDYTISIFVERQINDDAAIEAFTYHTGLMISGIDFSDELIPLKLELEDNRLNIIPIAQNIRLSIMGDSFPVRQFTGESLFDHSFSSGEQLIYLKIPKDLKLIADDVVILENVNRTYNK